MFDLNIVAGFSIIIISGIFVVWFFGKLTNTINSGNSGDSISN